MMQVIVARLNPGIQQQLLPSCNQKRPIIPRNPNVSWPSPTLFLIALVCSEQRSSTRYSPLRSLPESGMPLKIVQSSSTQQPATQSRMNVSMAYITSRALIVNCAPSFHATYILRSSSCSIIPLLVDTWECAKQLVNCRSMFTSLESTHTQRSIQPLALPARCTKQGTASSWVYYSLSLRAIGHGMILVQI